MLPRGPRLWETLRIDAGLLDVDPSGLSPAGDAADIAITATATGFTVSNSATTDASVLVTLMAKATDADVGGARERLVALTSCVARPVPLRVSGQDGADAYADLWQDDIDVRERPPGRWTATRSGAVLLRVPAGSAFALVHDATALRLGVVVAAVAAVGAGPDPDTPLAPVDRGPWASIGERPDSPR